MKKGICTLFCFMVVFFIFTANAFSSDYSSKAIPVFQELKKLDSEWGAAFMSGDAAAQKEKGKLLDAKKEEFTEILKTLSVEYCAAPQTDLLKEFIKTLVSITDEYPTYVFAELYACDPDNVTKEILALPLDDQKKICEDLNYGFKNITYKIEKLPNYKELKEKLDNLKKTIRTGK
jgi:hypothetical protein